MRVLVCGSRDWTDWKYLIRTLEEFHRVMPITLLIEGEARGADRMARWWAETRGIKVERYPADWDKYGKAAGPIRNTKMLKEGKPEAVIAFHENITESRGTRDMVRQAENAGIPVYYFPTGRP